MAYISKAALARKLQVSKARISAYVAKGMPVLKNGKCDEEACLAWVMKSVQPRAEAGTTAGAKLTNIRARRELARAQIAELELAEMRSGKLSTSSASTLAAELTLAAILARNGLAAKLGNYLCKRLALDHVSGGEVCGWINDEVRDAWRPIQQVIENLQKMSRGEPASLPTLEGFVARTDVAEGMIRMINGVRGILLGIPDRCPPEARDIVKRQIFATLDKLSETKFEKPGPEKAA